MPEFDPMDYFHFNKTDDELVAWLRNKVASLDTFGFDEHGIPIEEICDLEIITRLLDMLP